MFPNGGTRVKRRRAAASALAAVLAAATMLPASAMFPFAPEGVDVGHCTADNTGWEGFPHFIGALHEHSGYSDGEPGSKPADYFEALRASGLAFGGSSEHSDNARVPVTLSEKCLTPSVAACLQAPPEGVDKWEETGRQARAASDASFTAFRGFEWTSERFGHINVYFSRHDTNAKADGGHAAMESFWAWFTMRPEGGGGADGLATFNHPGREDSFAAADPGFNWNDFAHVPEADLRMIGIEVFNRASDYGTQRDNVPPGHPGWYVHALDKGWHVGPVGAEDDHERRWGSESRGKTIIIAPDNSAPALRAALLARRFYAVGPGRNDLRLSFRIDGQPMGARLGRPAGTRLLVQAEVTEGEFDGRLELVTIGGDVLAQTRARRLQRWIRVAADDAERWYFMRVLNKQGRPIAYTAPVWVRAGGPYPLCGEWLAGDLHVHSTYSHDAWSGPDDDNTGPDEAYTAGHTVERQFRIAALHGLDYLAITDHNDVRSQSDPGWGARGVIPIAGYEKSLAGHAQILGATRLYWKPSAPPYTALAEALRADDGVFQVNHPAEGSVEWPHDSDWREARPRKDETDPYAEGLAVIYWPRP